MERIEQKIYFEIRVAENPTEYMGAIEIMQQSVMNGQDNIVVEKQSIPALIDALKKYAE